MSFHKGDQVEVFSEGQQQWVSAKILDIALSDGKMNGYKVKKGTVLVEYSSKSTKYLTPDKVSSQLRAANDEVSTQRGVPDKATTNMLPNVSEEAPAPPTIANMISHGYPVTNELPAVKQKPTMSDSDDLQVVAVGDGGINQLKKHIDESTVMWAIVVVDVGEGTLRRKKALFLHVNGEYCGHHQRTRISQYNAKAKRLMSDTKVAHMPDVTVRRKEEVTLENILERVKDYFIVDSATYSVEWLVSEYERMIQEAKEKNRATAASDSMANGKTNDRRIPGHLAKELFESGGDALKQVKNGPANWMFWTDAAEPISMIIVEGGLGMPSDMAACLSEHTDKVMFGLIRMPFGRGRFELTKYVFIHAIGKDLPPVERGRQNQAFGKMKRLVQKMVVISVTLEVGTTEELTTGRVIEELRKAAVAVDEVWEVDLAAKDVFTEENFRNAIKEEQNIADRAEEEFLDEERCLGWAELRFDEVVKLVHSDGDANWALFAPGTDWNAGIVPPSIKIVPGKLRPNDTAQFARSGFLGALKRQQAPKPEIAAIAEETDGA